MYGKAVVVGLVGRICGCANPRLECGITIAIVKFENDENSMRPAVGGLREKVGVELRTGQSLSVRRCPTFAFHDNLHFRRRQNNIWSAALPTHATSAPIVSAQVFIRSIGCRPFL